MLKMENFVFRSVKIMGRKKSSKIKKKYDAQVGCV
jgi:hypothetical protein